MPINVLYYVIAYVKKYCLLEKTVKDSLKRLQQCTIHLIWNGRKGKTSRDLFLFKYTFIEVFQVARISHCSPAKAEFIGGKTIYTLEMMS